MGMGGRLVGRFGVKGGCSKTVVYPLITSLFTVQEKRYSVYMHTNNLPSITG